MLNYKNIKKNDSVKIIAGKDIGKTGNVLQVDRKKGKILVEGLNMYKKTIRKSQKNQQGGIKDIEAFFSISNIMLVCPKCKKTTRVGFETNDKGKKSRICKKCKNAID